MIRDIIYTLDQNIFKYTYLCPRFELIVLKKELIRRLKIARTFSS